MGRETHREREEPGGPAGETSAGPAEERTIRGDVDDPLEPRDEEPLERTFTVIRVRRVNL